MEVPLQIAFRNLQPSRAVEAKIRERAAWLERFCGRIISCRVAVEEPHQRHEKGNLFLIRIDLRVPGEELVVRRDAELHGAHKDVYVTIHDAFDEARRQLEDYVRRRRHVRAASDPGEKAS